jgi:hypothetical protein
MNAVVQFQPQAPTLPALSMTEIEHIATTIARGGLFGSKDPYAVATLCMLAYAEGQHPVSVFRDYHVISGKPSKKAEAMQRDFLSAGGKIEWHTLTDECADATFSHPTGGSARIAWDQARVKKAQLGSNAMHTKYPRQMLRSRVVSEGVRTVFPGATSGLYVPEEVQDFGDAPPRSIPAAPAPQRARDLTPIRDEQPALTDDRSPGRIKAEDWTNARLATINDTDTLDMLDDIAASDAKAMAKLSREHPDLHELVRNAEDARARRLRPSPRDTSPAPAADVASQEASGEALPEGPGDEDRGEVFATVDAEADILAHLARKVTVVDVNSLVSSRRGELDSDGQDRLLEAASLRIAEIKGGK